MNKLVNGPIQMIILVNGSIQMIRLVHGSILSTDNATFLFPPSGIVSLMDLDTSLEAYRILYTYRYLYIYIYMYLVDR